MFLLSFVININNQYKDKYFNNTYLSFNKGYYLSFDKINKTLDKINVYINGEETFNISYISNLSQLALINVQQGFNHVLINIYDTDIKTTYNFYLNIKDEIYINDTGFYSLNSNLTCDQDITFKDEYYLNLNNYFYEINDGYYYYDIEALFDLSFNKNYILSNNIELVIFNEGLFDYLLYDNGYHFSLSMINKDGKYHLKFKDVSDKSINLEAVNKLEKSNKLYYPIDLDEAYIDSQIIFNDIFATSSKLIVPQVININKHLFTNDYFLDIKNLSFLNKKEGKLCY